METECEDEEDEDLDTRGGACVSDHHFVVLSLFKAAPGSGTCVTQPSALL